MIAAFITLAVAPWIADGLVVSCARMETQPPYAIASENKFLVCFRNTGRAPIKLLAEACSWGYEAISFDAVNAAGKHFPITRKLRGWDKNFPMPVPVRPGGAVVRSIDFGDGTWQGMPAGIAGHAQDWQFRAILNVAADSTLAQDGFWQGTRSSAWTKEADLKMPSQSRGSVVVSLARGEREDITPHLGGSLMVAFSNPGSAPITLLSEECSMGYDMLSFEVTNPAGKRSSIVRAPKDWYRNFPIPVVIPPGATVVRPVNFADHTWQGFPAGVAGQAKGWTIRALLTRENDVLSVKKGYWIGRQASPWSPLAP